ncbi:hypothetical protein EHI44_33370 [Rhizobium leguminosarum]|uniref:DUF6894 family protein n=1 Tax=Rhizobium leguminosarum TaxID=384 RepID=UPI000FEED124|nr:hypothetical protein [Rhizobium leguminosarum]RWY77902.1 hypothetical protein EHI44_33370 [Rhizobium leguminosarum]
MTTFFFSIKDDDGEFHVDNGLEFIDLAAALGYAHHVLSEMAVDGIPNSPEEEKSVAIEGPDRQPMAVMSIRITLDFIQPSAPERISSGCSRH